MTEPEQHDTDFTLPAEAVTDFLAHGAVVVSEHYYAAGDIDVKPVVLTLRRVSEEEYADLAQGLDSTHIVGAKK